MNILQYKQRRLNKLKKKRSYNLIIIRSSHGVGNLELKQEMKLINRLDNCKDLHHLIKLLKVKILN